MVSSQGRASEYALLNETQRANQNKQDTHNKDSVSIMEAPQVEAATGSRGGLSSKPLPMRFVITSIKQRVVASGLYSDFVLYVPFLVMFVFFFLNGRDIEANHMVAGAARATYFDAVFYTPNTVPQMIDDTPINQVPEIEQYRGLFDVGQASDWYQFFHDAIIPATWDCDAPDFPRQTLSKRGQTVYFGAMRIRVLNVANTSCTTNAKVTGGSHKQCFGSYGFTTPLMTTSTCNTTNPANPTELLWTFFDDTPNSVLTTGSKTVYADKGFMATIPFNATCNQVRALADLMSSDAACAVVQDRSTRIVQFEWFEYNTYTDSFLSVKLFHEITSAGAWIANHQFRMTAVWTSRRLWSSVFDIFFMLLVIYFAYRFVTDLLTYRRQTGNVFAFFFDVWNVLEFSNLSIFVAVFALRCLWWAKSLGTDLSFPFPTAYPGQFDTLTILWSMQIYVNAVNVVITFLKMLKYARLNDRLSVLTRTLAICRDSIAGILILSLLVVVGYSLAAMNFYGTNILQFRDLNTSFSSLMFFILGGSNFDQMQALNPLFTGLYYFSFIILAKFLLFNFIIAILSEGFAQANQDIAHEPLEEAVLRQLRSIRYLLAPRNIKRVVQLRLKGKSRTDLVFEMGKYLQEHIDLVETNAPELLDEEMFMTKRDLRHWLPEKLHRNLGSYYIDYLWDDLVHEHTLQVMGGGYVEEKRVETIVAVGVRSPIEQRTQRPLDEMESSAEGLLEACRRLGVAVGASPTDDNLQIPM